MAEMNATNATDGRGRKRKKKNDRKEPPKMRSRWAYIASLLFSLTGSVFCDPISLALGGAVAMGGAAFYAWRDKLNCRFFECCDAPYILPNFEKMEKDLSHLVFGQHIVQSTVLPAIQSHLKKQPNKPLVLSFHGTTGTGKNHVSQIIAKNLYQKGMESRFVHHIVATAEFPDKSKTSEYKLALQDRLVSAFTSCPRVLFIFDEVDKLPESLLSAIKPYLDYHDTVKGIDFRRAIFILLSNAGGDALSRQAIRHRQEGRVRGQLKENQLERVVSEQVFNTAGGLKMSELISSHLIDHFVPFLPLEREHVKRCIEYYLESVRFGSSQDEELFYPAGDPFFSSSGCKRVEQKADIALYRRKKEHTKKNPGFSVIDLSDIKDEI